MCVSLHVYEPVSAWCPWSPEDKSPYSFLELVVAVSCPLGAGNQTRDLWEGSRCVHNHPPPSAAESRSYVLGVCITLASVVSLTQ